MNSQQQQWLAGLVSRPVQWQCRLDRYTSLGVGGPAEALVIVDRRQELAPLLAFLGEQQIPWRVIGRGTNLLVRDQGFAGAVLVLGTEFKTVDRRGTGDRQKILVQAGAGCALIRLALDCIEWGLAGMEFACGIPGTLGGAVVMNAGAWGSEMSAIVHSVGLTTAEGEKRLDGEALDFSYRCWPGFAAYQGRAVVIEVELALTEEEPATIRQRCAVLQDRRKKSQHCLLPNAGSFFKNPPGDSAGRLIDKSGLKGLTVGGAMISPHHANFLVNKGGATAADVINLMQMVQAKVKLDSNIDLEPEVHIL